MHFSLFTCTNAIKCTYFGTLLYCYNLYKHARKLIEEEKVNWKGLVWKLTRTYSCLSQHIISASKISAFSWGPNSNISTILARSHQLVDRETYIILAPALMTIYTMYLTTLHIQFHVSSLLGSQSLDNLAHLGRSWHRYPPTQLIQW